MSQEISNPVTHAIIFHDKSHKLITASQYNYILSQSGKTFFVTPALGYITMSSIARIPEIEDFYEQFPDKKSQYLNYTPKEELPPEYAKRTDEENKKMAEFARNGIIRGLQLFCSNNPGSKNAEEILSNILNGKSATKSKNYWQAVVEKYQNKIRNPSEEEHYQFAKQSLSSPREGVMNNF
jgi:hypothetical protein